MTQFINKSTIKAEIERLVKEYRLSNSAEAKYRCEAYSELLDFINSLQEEPVSNDLEEAAKKAGQKYFPNENNIWARPNYEAIAAANAFKEGTQWQKQQDQSTIELAEDHAYLAGQEKVIEKACEFIETYPHLFMGVLRSEVIEDFKNYIKGE